MPVSVKLVAVQTFFKQDDDPQFRCEIKVENPDTGDIETYSDGCSGDVGDCPEDVALSVGYTFEDV